MRAEIVSAYSQVSHFIPDGSRVVLFGSSIREDNPSDIDIIIVYDRDVIDPKEAFHSHDKFIIEMSRLVTTPIHVTMLNKSEYLSSPIKLSEELVELTS